MPKIIVLALHSETGDTLNASHAIIELTPELEAKLNGRVERLTELLKNEKVQAMIYDADEPIFLPIDEQIVRGEPIIQEITDERLANLKRFDEMLEIGLIHCEMRIERNGEAPAEIRLYMNEKHTGLEIYTSEFLWAGKTPFKLVSLGPACSECGAPSVVVSDRNKPLCADCGLEEAERQTKADAPGVWPDWADSLLAKKKAKIKSGFCKYSVNVGMVIDLGFDESQPLPTGAALKNAVAAILIDHPAWSDVKELPEFIDKIEEIERQPD